MKINLISLGCSKNLVDSEVILGRLGERGYSLTTSPEDADIIIINTCSFIKEARKESHQIISKIASQKSSLQKLIVCGCLPQLERRKLFARYPQIDVLLGSADFYKIDGIIREILDGRKRLFLVNTPRFLYNSNFPRLLTTPPSYAYLKIAEGCFNRCSYCLIPYLRGDYRSRTIDDVIKEARALADLGVQELILIAQDTTFYGKDLEGKYLLSSLLKKLQKINKIKWIRLLYTHPAHFDSSLIQTIANSDKICRYLDIPLQHSHNEILTKMRRPE
ncbi:MAG: MiaB/RimO family radical SAM methylthiotransferase, partial [Candidatus Aerophobetes bacterium]|nr:MiaB/RimO family radical SAM methylthiotransferase [Candidatus Aerophobetes bacterium]